MRDSHKSLYVSPEIKLSSFEEKTFRTEIFLEHHVLVWFISGEARIILSNQTHTFSPGDVILFPRNQMATFINCPKDGRPFKSVVLNLTDGHLQNFYRKRDVSVAKTPRLPRLIVLQKHTLLDSFLMSLMPCFENDNLLPDNIASIKVEEAINILRFIEPGVDELLANFDVPGKINLSDFMEKNYMFNLPLNQFARLTGRSLSTFKRDFEKTFNTTPQRWLTRKRLELAHYQLSVKQQKPADVCFEVGFANLSHFSHIFKMYFGYCPRDVKIKTA